MQSRRIVRLTQDYTIKPFDCGNADLNDFLLNDAKHYASHLLAVTYLLEDETELSEKDTVPMYYDLTQLI